MLETDQFRTMFSLKQAMQSATHITFRRTSLIDHILASNASRVLQYGVVNVRVPDHQFIYCARKVNRMKTGCSQT